MSILDDIIEGMKIIKTYPPQESIIVGREVAKILTANGIDVKHFTVLESPFDENLTFKENKKAVN